MPVRKRRRPVRSSARKVEKAAVRRPPTMVPGLVRQYLDVLTLVTVQPAARILQDAIESGVLQHPHLGIVGKPVLVVAPGVGDGVQEDLDVDAGEPAGQPLLEGRQALAPRRERAPTRRKRDTPRSTMLKRPSTMGSQRSMLPAQPMG